MSIFRISDKFAEAWVAKKWTQFDTLLMAGSRIVGKVAISSAVVQVGRD
jgi:hypothetical protein